MTQSPLCGAALNYTLTPSQPWAVVTGSNVDISANSLALASSYSFILSAKEPLTGTISTDSPLLINLVDPCEITTIYSVEIPQQILYAWQSTTLTLAIPFTDF